jgi:ribonuclease D
MNRFKAEISKEELLSYEVVSFNGEIICIDREEQLESAMSYLWNCSVVGFDTETRPTFKKGQRNNVALLQLSANGKAFLFRLNSIGLPKMLTKFLSSEDVKKIGVAIHDDIKELKQLNSFEARGFIDLQDLVKEYGIISAGLKKLSAIVLGYSISKRQQVTNWENESLTQAQQLYAATDAWVCLKIYETLIRGN